MLLGRAAATLRESLQFGHHHSSPHHFIIKNKLCNSAEEITSESSTKLNRIYKRATLLTPAEKLERFSQTTLRKAGVTETSNMDASILWPSENVRGMTTLQTDMFKKTITVPIAHVKLIHISPVLKILKSYYLKMRQFFALEEGPDDADYKIIYMNPLSFSANETKIKEQIAEVYQTIPDAPSDLVEFKNCSLTLSYENWDSAACLRAILPLDTDGVSGFSTIGHIIHLNLKEQLEPFKKVIGQILLDKSAAEVTMVVNKLDTIDKSDNTFRSFSMEILAGEGGTEATVKENKCSFTFDFAKVYWNPRLSTEHETIVHMLSNRDVLYDVMAGVGPFAVPAASHKKCEVLANDLNPESFRWLQHNVKQNKVETRVDCHNLDGGEFIKTTLKKDLLNRWRNPDFQGQLHVTMNLPSIAVEFLPHFVGLMADIQCDEDLLHFHEPLIHVYMFSKDQKASSCVTTVAFQLGLVNHLPDFDAELAARVQARDAAVKNQNLDEAKSKEYRKTFGITYKFVNDVIDIPGLKVKEVKYVRKVAPNKGMIRVSVFLTRDILCCKNKTKFVGDSITESERCKRIKLDNES